MNFPFKKSRLKFKKKIVMLIYINNTLFAPNYPPLKRFLQNLRSSDSVNESTPNNIRSSKKSSKMKKLQKKKFLNCMSKKL